MKKAIPLVPVIAFLALAAAAKADAPEVSSQDWLRAQCRDDAQLCTKYLLFLEVQVLIDQPPPYACIRKSDYIAKDTFRPDRIDALVAWWDSHPDPTVTTEVLARRGLLAVFPETPECLADQAAGR